MADLPDGRQDKPIRIRPKVAVGAVVAVLALVFIFQNTEKGRIEFLFWNLSMPAWIWLLIVFVSGVAVGSLFPWMRGRRGSDPR